MQTILIEGGSAQQEDGIAEACTLAEQRFPSLADAVSSLLNDTGKIIS